MEYFLGNNASLRQAVSSIRCGLGLHVYVIHALKFHFRRCMCTLRDNQFNLLRTFTKTTADFVFTQVVLAWFHAVVLTLWVIRSCAITDLR